MRTQMLMPLALGIVACASTDPLSHSAGPAAPPAVTVQRDELAPKVSRYLTQIAALEPAYLGPDIEFPTNGLLPGWGNQICPEVRGFPVRETNFIYSRVSDIARTAGAHLAGKGCRPNLHVIMTAKPAELVKDLEKQNAIGAYGPRGRAYLVNEFIAQTRPVKAWYDVWGGSGNFRFNLSDVFVIADQTQLRGVALGQLADYIAMVGLAEIKPGAHLEDAPTILKLFEGAPQVAPAGLSAWDQAFLKALYTTATWPHLWQIERCEYSQQCEVDQVTLRMVNEIVPQGVAQR